MGLVCIFAALCLCWPSHASVLQLPSHFAVPVKTNSDLDPRVLRIGDSVTMAVAADLHIDGCLVFREGAPVIAIVTEARRPGSIGRPSLIALEIKSTVAADGTVIPLSGSMRAEGEDRSVESLGAALEFCCLGIFIPGGRRSIGRDMGTIAVTASAMEVQCQDD